MTRVNLLFDHGPTESRSYRIGDVARGTTTTGTGDLWRTP